MNLSPRRAWIPAALLPFAILCIFTIDQPVARLMADNGALLVHVFTVITWFGQGGVVLYPTGAMLLAALWLRPRLPSLMEALDRLIRRAIMIFATVAGAGLVNDLFKIVFGRARPRMWLGGDLSGFQFLRYGAKFASFPSGHTATSVAAAVALGALFPRWRAGFAFAALLIAGSRVIIDAHYVSDVLAGAAVGGVTALLIVEAFRRSRKFSGVAAQDFARRTVDPVSL
jgi:membrane-associated phospholipid phosphatase